MHRLITLLLSSLLLLVPVARAAEPAPPRVDETIINRLSPSAQSVAVDSSGRILALGGGGRTGDRRPVRVARLLPGGGRDRSFGERGIASTDLAKVFGRGQWSVPRSLAVDDRDRSYVPFAPFGGSGESGVIRFTATGELDSSWGEDGIAWLDLGRAAWAGAVVADDHGGLLVGLRVDQSDDGPADATVLRLDGSGAIDPGFGTDGEVRLPEGEYVSGLELDPRGRVVVTVDASWGEKRPIFRLLPDGELDRSFGDGGAVTLPLDDVDRQHVELDGEGRLLVGSTGYDYDRRMTITRLRPDGELDPTFGDGGTASLTFGALQSRREGVFAVDGRDRIVLGAGLRLAHGRGHETDVVLARLTAEGEPDPTFGADGEVTIDVNGGDDRLSALIVAPGGEIIAAGATQSAGRGPSGAITRISP